MEISDVFIDNKPKILVIGSTGVGKTTLINEITHNDTKSDYNNFNRYVEDDNYNFSRSVEDDNYKYVDISYQPDYADRIFNSIVSEQHFNLIIFVIKKVNIRDTRDIKYIYDFLISLFNKDVPIILCVTCCEGDDPMDKWIKENVVNFQDAGFSFSDYLGVSFARYSIQGKFEELYKKLRNESVSILKEKINRNLLDKPVPLVFFKDNKYDNFIDCYTPYLNNLSRLTNNLNHYNIKIDKDEALNLKTSLLELNSKISTTDISKIDMHKPIISKDYNKIKNVWNNDLLNDTQTILSELKINVDLTIFKMNTTLEEVMKKINNLLSLLNSLLENLNILLDKIIPILKKIINITIFVIKCSIKLISAFFTITMILLAPIIAIVSIFTQTTFNENYIKIFKTITDTTKNICDCLDNLSF
jgi:GTPase SAR1 family protein